MSDKNVTSGLRSRSVCMFSAITSMINMGEDLYAEYEIFWHSNGNKFYLEYNIEVPLLKLNLEYYLGSIDRASGSKSILKRNVAWDTFVKDVNLVTSAHQMVILYLYTGNLRYSSVYRDSRSGKHCLLVTNIENEKCLIEDKHIRVGNRLEEYIGWVDASEIQNQIISYAYQTEKGKRMVLQNDLLKRIADIYVEDIGIMEAYLDKIIACLEKSKNIENDCLENYIHMNVFSGLHYWCYLYDYINTLNAERNVKNLALLVDEQINNWDLCKVLVLKYSFSKDISPILNRVAMINELDSRIFDTIREIISGV